jgi:uncharacterized protein YlaI
MVEQETVKCGRCDKWFEREKEKNARIKKEGKVKEYLCPDCDEEINKENSFFFIYSIFFFIGFFYYKQ